MDGDGIDELLWTPFVAGIPHGFPTGFELFAWDGSSFVKDASTGPRGNHPSKRFDLANLGTGYCPDDLEVTALHGGNLFGPDANDDVLVECGSIDAGSHCAMMHSNHLDGGVRHLWWGFTECYEGTFAVGDADGNELEDLLVYDASSGAGKFYDLTKGAPPMALKVDTGDARREGGARHIVFGRTRRASYPKMPVAREDALSFYVDGALSQDIAMLWGKRLTYEHAGDVKKLSALFR
jgi:hypothetical protein